MQRGLVVLVFCLSTTPALGAAQGVVVETTEGLDCAPFDTTRECAGGSCPSPGDVCRGFGIGSFCVPPEGLMCILSASTPCPTGTSVVDVLGLHLCLETGARLCEDPSDRACFTKAGAPGAFPVAWTHGDCDADGLANGDELAGGLCVVPRRIGVSTGADCERPPVCVDECAEGACVAVEGTDHRYCLPDSDTFIFCCGGFVAIECPDANECQTVPGGSDVLGFCDPFDYCPELEFGSRLACLEGPGGFPVPAEEGDCDGDGVSNGVEEDPRDPCVAEGDAGVSDPDAGTVPPRDAGAVSPRDGGAATGDASMDGALPARDAGARAIEPRFTGGGGCRCGAAPPRRGGAGLALLAVVALSIARRRQGA